MISQALPRLLPCFVLFVIQFRTCLIAEDQPQLGQAFNRNMVSAETGIPATFNLETGENVKWTVALGHSNYATPVAGRQLLPGLGQGRYMFDSHRGRRPCLHRQQPR